MHDPVRASSGKSSAGKTRRLSRDVDVTDQIAYMLMFEIFIGGVEFTTLAHASHLSGC